MLLTQRTKTAQLLSASTKNLHCTLLSRIYHSFNSVTTVLDYQWRLVWKCIRGEAPSYMDMCSGWFDRRSSTAALCFVQLSDGPTNSWTLSVSRHSLCSGLRRGTNYLHFCDRRTRHYKRFELKAHLFQQYTIAVLWPALLFTTVSATPNTNSWLTYTSIYYQTRTYGG